MSARLRDHRFATVAPFLAMATVLVSLSLSHHDDIDALYYKSLAANIGHTHDWFRLVWAQLPGLAFNDHLSPGFWLIGLSEKCLGDRGTRLFYSGLTLLAFLLLVRLARRFSLEREGLLAVWVAVFTESFIRPQAQPRLDPPFLLLWMASLFVAGTFSPAAALASGLLAGLGSLFRAPPSLALLVLVPALALVQRRAEGRRVAAKDLKAGAFFLLAFALPLALFHLADSHLSKGDALQRYLHSQVLPSLRGTRTDGQGSHWAPIRSVIGRFWPGLPLCIAAAVFAVRRPRGVPSFVRYCAASAVAVVLGFSLGRRHVASHLWPAYLALFVIAGWGWARIVDLIASRLETRRLPARALLPLAGLVSAALMSAALIAFTPSCDVWAARGAVVDPEQCQAIVIASADDSRDWFTAHRVVDHTGRDISFAPGFMVPEDSRDRAGCRSVAFTATGNPVPPSWILLRKGHELSLYQLPRH